MPSSPKLEIARQFGATHAVDSRTNPKAVDEVLAITEGGDHVFDLVGITPVVQSSLEMVGRGGGLLFLVGLADSVVTLPVLEAAAMEKSVSGVIMGSTTIKRDIPVYAKLYQDGRFKLDELVTDRIALSEVNEGFERLKDGSTIRVVITDFDN